MMRFPVAAFLGALALAPAAAQSVQLADGRVLLATVEHADGGGLRVRRLDNGGVLELRWDHLSTASANAWQRRFDLLGDAQEEPMTRADEVEYLIKGSRQTVVGRIVDPAADPLVVQAKGVTYPVRRADLRSVRKVDAPVVQVFTKDEWYGLQLAELQPGDQADRHMLLAENLVKVRDYERATEHLQRAKELGNSRNPKHLETLLARLQRFKEAQKELKLLEDVQAARSRGQLADFEKGTKLLQQFEQEFPQSKLKAEFDAEKKRFGEARLRYLSQQVAEHWRRSIQIVGEKKLAEDGLSLQAARDYAQGKMTDDIVARVAGVLRLTPDEVKQLWADRARYPVGKRSEHFGYGVGSWVLGEAAILKDTAAGRERDKQKDPEPANDRDVDRLAKLLRQALERRRQQVQGQASGEKEQTDEDWWRQAERAERSGWLRAFYAEFGGQLVVTFATASPCISCYGEGTTPDIASDGKMVRAKCFLCQSTKWTRSFKAY